VKEEVRFPRAQHASLRLNVLSTLRSYILAGRLQPGDRLMENEIARQMGISRAPVREAIRQLEQEGLVESSPHRGTYVTSLPDDEIEQIYQARALLEGYAARRAARRISVEDLQRLRVLLQEMRQAVQEGDLVRLAEKDLAFHEEILRLSGSRTIMRVWASMDAIIRNRTYSIMRRSARSDIIEYTAESHQPLLDALASGDEERAEQAVRQHIFETRDLIAPAEVQAGRASAM